MGILFPSDEFLSQLLFDFPDFSPVPSSIYTPTGSSAFEQAPASIPCSAPIPQLTCYWVSRDDPFVCGASIPSDSKHACEHFRVAHGVRGNDKATVSCLWYACSAPPMQRGSLIRHLLTVHLKLLRWKCEACGRVFSRRGSAHVCAGEVGA